MNSLTPRNGRHPARHSAPPGDAGEREASAAGRAAARGQTASIGNAPGAAISRQEYPGAAGGNLTLPSVDLIPEKPSPLLEAALGSATLDGFATGKADLTSEHLGQIAMTAQSINRLLRQWGTSTVEIIGQTDTVGEEADNFRLGQARADAVIASPRRNPSRTMYPGTWVISSLPEAITPCFSSQIDSSLVPSSCIHG